MTQDPAIFDQTPKKKYGHLTKEETEAAYNEIRKKLIDISNFAPTWYGSRSKGFTCPGCRFISNKAKKAAAESPHTPSWVQFQKDLLKGDRE